MKERDWLKERFEAHRSLLGAVAYRMLGSRAEADDAVQEAWLRLAGAETTEVDDLRAWLTTVVGRVCLTRLRSRRWQRESVVTPRVRDSILTSPNGGDPEEEALLGDSVGLALLAVLDTMTSAERIAFVLHEIFAVPFDQIGPIVQGTPSVARQLTNRARRRVRGASPHGGHTSTHRRV